MKGRRVGRRGGRKWGASQGKEQEQEQAEGEVRGGTSGVEASAGILPAYFENDPVHRPLIAELMRLLALLLLLSLPAVAHVGRQNVSEPSKRGSEASASSGRILRAAPTVKCSSISSTRKGTSSLLPILRFPAGALSHRPRLLPPLL
eukprot:681937-Hanusia_phi.AAC.2